MQSACSGREHDGLKGLKEEKKREKGLKERQCVGSPEYKGVLKILRLEAWAEPRPCLAG